MLAVIYQSAQRFSAFARLQTQHLFVKAEENHGTPQAQQSVKPGPSEHDGVIPSQLSPLIKLI
jgi:hypothetical protein